MHSEEQVDFLMVFGSLNMIELVLVRKQTSNESSPVAIQKGSDMKGSDMLQVNPNARITRVPQTYYKLIQTHESRVFPTIVEIPRYKTWKTQYWIYSTYDAHEKRAKLSRKIE